MGELIVSIGNLPAKDQPTCTLCTARETEFPNIQICAIAHWRRSHGPNAPLKESSVDLSYIPPTCPQNFVILI